MEIFLRTSGSWRLSGSWRNLLVVAVLVCGVTANPDAKRLYDDLLSNYNKLVRPVANVTDALTVRIKLKLSQLIDVNLKNQIMTTNLWVEQYWYDYKLQWDPKEYGGVDMLHVPSEHIWRPDIVLYNNADGNFEVTLATKATMRSDGLIEWKPPAIYKSSCEIDVEYFPFDEQTCVMKFGSWTYDGFQVDLRHKDESLGSSVVDIGVDLTEFYLSVEWDILQVPAVRNMKFYTCCDEPYLDITFNITMRRKTLFYTVNLIIPCMGISFLTVLVFYLPSDSGEKVSLAISILLSLTVFFLLLAEIIPPTSLVVPLLGKFVLFTMILDTFSICVTVVVLNVHFRSPQTHTMSPWVRRVFIHILPRLLVMRRPHYAHSLYGPTSSRHRVLVRTCHGLEFREPTWLAGLSLSGHGPTTLSSEVTAAAAAMGPSHNSVSIRSAPDLRAGNTDVQWTTLETMKPRRDETSLNGQCRVHGPASRGPSMDEEADHGIRGGGGGGGGGGCVNGVLGSSDEGAEYVPGFHPCPEVMKAMDGLQFIAEHTRREQESIRVKEDWKYVAMVLDRLFLWIFTLAVLVGTAAIILQAPTLYDDREPIDIKLSEIAMAGAGKPVTPPPQVQ